LAIGAVRERTKGRLWQRVVVAVALVFAGGSAFAMWWMTTLRGLPDIGDPFDVAAFTENPIPDDENAYTLYAQAARLIGEEPQDNMSFDWSTAGPVEKGWLEQKREALEIWRLGTERSKALYIPSRSMNLMTQLTVVDDIRKFMRLAKLEAGRLEAAGDLEGAWRWDRAIFRSSRHVGHHATAIERFVGGQMHSVATRQLIHWANDPKITPALVRKALDAVIDDYATTARLSDTLKVEYLTFLKTYDDPNLVWKCLNDENISFAGAGKPPWFVRDPKVFSLARAFRTEPERSRRVVRLVYANLLAVCDLPPDRRPPVAATLVGLIPTGKLPLVDLYTMDASAPAPARALTPAEIRDWFDSTLYARQLMGALKNIVQGIDRERVTQATLVIALANRLYEVERGKAPSTVEELVGPYLKALPEGYQRIEP
jgi:hypothetical protein